MSEMAFTHHCFSLISLGAVGLTCMRQGTAVSSFAGESQISVCEERNGTDGAIDEKEGTPGMVFMWYNGQKHSK